MNLHIKKPGNQVGHLVWLSRGGGGGACPNQPNTFRALISLTPLFTAVINGITRVRVFMSIVYNIKGGARLTPEMYQCFTGWPLEREGRAKIEPFLAITHQFEYKSLAETFFCERAPNKARIKMPFSHTYLSIKSIVVGALRYSLIYGVKARGIWWWRRLW